MMRAVLHRRYGTAREVLEYITDFPVPVPGPDDILVRVHATSVNPIDCAVRRGYGSSYFKKIGILHCPHIPGRDVAGDVVAKGSNVTTFAPGDRIWAGVFGGASAEFVLVDARNAARLPPTLSYLDAAAFPFAGLTAWTALVTHAGLTPGDAGGKKVIVPRGGGGVGSFAIQLLKAWDAQVATIVSPRNIPVVTALGADVVIDHTREDFSKRIHDYDVALDTSFDTEKRLLDALKIHADAVYVSVVTPKLRLIDELGLDEGLKAGETLLAERVAEQAALGRRYAWSFMQPNAGALDHVAGLYETGRMRSVIDSVFPLCELAAAHERSESGQASGKIVIEI